MTLATARVDELALDEHERLQELETVVERNLRAFHEAGAALLEIRDSRLYRESHGTFEDYCRERWGMQRAHAYRLMEASEVVAGLSPNGDTPVPSNEGQARALGQFDEDLRPAIMRATKAHSDDYRKPITAGLIEGVGRVLTEAVTTGHVDVGDGTSTPILAAIVAESFEHTQRQSQHIRDHYEDHDGQGHLTPEARADRETPQAASNNERPDLGSTPAPYTAPHVSHNSGNNEWYTPKPYLQAAHEVMGGIDLDPASSPKANENVSAAHIYTADDDGLEHAWFGRVWLNPPYSGDLVGRFAEKTVAELKAGNVAQAIVLVNNATETAWFQHLAEHATAMCFPRGRIRYLDHTGEPKQSPLQGQTFLYFGLNHEHFEAVFSTFGVTR